MVLPINIDALLGATTVESSRIEYKESWNPNTIYRSICAFANDFDNSGGGYILVGVEEENGIAKRPIKGLDANQLDKIQREMIGLNNLIRPTYRPLVFIETVDSKQVMVIWVPGSSSRPHEVPEVILANQKTFFHYIRTYSSSVKANAEQRQELISLANQIPFDDRANSHASESDISFVWLREYLRQTESRLLSQIEKLSINAILDQMELQAGPPEFHFPRNVALMLFCEYPEKFFPYTYIEVVHFRLGPADREFNEVTFKGPVQSQIQQLTGYLRNNVLVEKVIKVNYQSESIRIWNYPFEAIQEAIANCIFHRDYMAHEPVKVLIHNDKIILRNAGGPDRSIKIEDFQLGQVRPKRYRNRRLGNFLKTLRLTEGHATGIPLILKALKDNGSPEPVFDMDEQRTYLEVEFKMHPAFKIEPVVSVGRVNASYVDQVIDGMRTDTLVILARMGKEPLKRVEVLELAGLANHNSNVERYLDPLRKIGAIALTIEDRPKSPKQRYVLTPIGQQIQKYLRHSLDVADDISNQLTIDFNGGRKSNSKRSNS